MKIYYVLYRGMWPLNNEFFLKKSHAKNKRRDAVNKWITKRKDWSQLAQRKQYGQSYQVVEGKLK